VGAGLMSIGIPKDSVLRYDVALKTNKFILLLHGSADQLERAKAIVHGTQHSSYIVHRDTVLA
jgi:hypothetical protein